MKIKTDEDLNLWAQSSVIKTHEARFDHHNALSILFGLTGYRFSDLSDGNQQIRARKAVRKALELERKRARLGRCEYDVNRHISLFQANKTLIEMTVDNGEMSYLPVANDHDQTPTSK